MIPPAIEERANGDASPAAVVAYEIALQQNPRWALTEGSRHFDEQSALFQTLRGITQRLDELQISYAVVGGMALFRHGLRRFTEDVDILVTKADLRRIHAALEGRGYLPPFAKSKNLRDTQSGVRIEFLTTGDYPGDGKPKPVAFPDPADVSFEAEGVRYLKLETLIELKLASGMTNVGRLKDLSDVLELVKTLNLPREFGESLNPYVRAKFAELWQQSLRRFVQLWRRKIRSPDMVTFDAHIGMVREAMQELEHSPLKNDARTPSNLQLMRESIAHLEQMQRDGLELEYRETSTGGVLYLVSTDPVIASQYGLVDESELWDESSP